MKISTKASLACVLAVAVINPATAYVGPGAGLSLLSAPWGLPAAVFAALAFVVLWPIRRMMKTRREKRGPADTKAHATDAPETPIK